MLRCRNSNIFKNKWLNEWQKLVFVYGEWGIESEIMMYDYYEKLYYKNIKEQLTLGFTLNQIKDVIKIKLDNTVKEMSNRLERDGKFEYGDNEEIIWEFCYMIVILSKFKAIESSNNFGILRTGKKLFEIVEVY
jgi:hypothetical protein